MGNRRATPAIFETDRLTIGGVNWLDPAWRSTGDQVRLPHPAYPNQLHWYTIEELRVSDDIVRFAVTELSVGVYGVYVPAEQSAEVIAEPLRRAAEVLEAAGPIRRAPLAPTAEALSELNDAMGKPSGRA